MNLTSRLSILRKALLPALLFMAGTSSAMAQGLTGSEAPPDFLPHDLSPWGMYMNADVVVKSVMAGLALASLLTWTIVLAKTVAFAFTRRRLRRSAAMLSRARTLTDALGLFTSHRDTVSRMVREAGEEMALSEAALDTAGASGVKERVSSRLAQILLNANAAMKRGTGLLATIGSIGPFVGLFGTVWGIMNAFIGISRAQTTNLSVVAPGIAEALLATALGLVAAIPAVIAYNVFARWLAGHRLRLAEASAAIERLVSRDLDYRATVRA